MELTNINLTLQDTAQNIEIPDAFNINPSVAISDHAITVTCSDDDVTRVIDFNFDKSTITELSVSDLFTGGTVYSMTGEILKIIN